VKEVITDAYFDRKTKKVLHPTKYQTRISRAIDSHYTRISQPEQPENFLQTSWKCAFCQRGSCEGDLGDLYGPYFVNIHADLKSPPPNFLRLKNADESVCIDADSMISIWMHGNCSLWTPAMQLVGGRLSDLCGILRQSWNQKCIACKKPGASIPVGNDCNVFIHFPCANEGDYDLNQRAYMCIKRGP